MVTADCIARVLVVPRRARLPIREDDRRGTVVVDHADASILQRTAVIGVDSDQVGVPQRVLIDQKWYLDQIVEPLGIEPVFQVWLV